MPKVSILFVLIAAVLSVARLYTGILVSCDSAESFYIFKNHPALFIEKNEQCPDELNSYIHTLGEENGVVFEEEYVALMTAAPLVVPVLLMGAAALFIRHRRRS
jgi:hypothetical protein